jgi:hypothetical protein
MLLTVALVIRVNGQNNEIKMEKPTFKMVKVNITILQLIFTISFYPFTILVQKFPYYLQSSSSISGSFGVSFHKPFGPN